MTIHHTTHSAPCPSDNSLNGFLPALDVDGIRYLLTGHWYADENVAAACAEAMEHVLNVNTVQLLHILGFKRVKDI